MKRTACALAFVAVLAGFPASASANPHEQASVVTPEPELPIIGGGEIVAAQLTQYVAAVERDEVGRYLVAVAEAEAAAAIEAQRQAEAEAAAEEARRAASAPRAAAPSNVTGACGGATNGADQFIQRESGGNPNIYNSSSGAWGCYQLMPMHFAPGGTCDDMSYGSATPAQQAECASRLPLSAWALG